MDNFSLAVNRYWREFKKLSQKQKIIIIAILTGAFLFGILLPVGINKFSNYQPAKVLPSPTPIPLPAVISLSSDKDNISAGATFSATININSPNQGVEAADFVVNFDPDFLKVSTVSAGNYFGLYPIKQSYENQVKISGVANLVNNKFIIPLGKGKIGTIVFTALSATNSTKISFDHEKTIVASGGNNILDKSKITDLKLKIK